MRCMGYFTGLRGTRVQSSEFRVYSSLQQQTDQRSQMRGHSAGSQARAVALHEAEAGAVRLHGGRGADRQIVDALQPR